MNSKHREQIADFILKDSDGKDLVVTSDLQSDESGALSFVVGEDAPDGARYQVTIKIEEI